jgi:hypothetical protein
MAEITLSSGSICRPYRSPWGAFPIKHMSLVSTTPAVLLGRMMHLNWTANSTDVGKVVPSTADNFFFGVGIAAQAQAALTSSAVAGPVIPIWEANPNVEFIANTKGVALGSSQIGLHKTLHWDSTLGINYVDLTASTASDWRVVITGIAGENGLTGLQGQIGDTGGQVTFRFLSHLADNIGSSVALTSTSPVLAFYPY